MSGYKIYKKVIARLGYNESKDQKLLERALEAINQICADLKLPPASSLSEEITNDLQTEEAICCGAAMLLALNEGDGEKNRIFTEIYNSKRAGLLSCNDRVVDMLPVAESGVS